MDRKKRKRRVIKPNTTTGSKKRKLNLVDCKNLREFANASLGKQMANANKILLVIATSSSAKPLCIVERAEISHLSELAVALLRQAYVTK